MIAFIIILILLLALLLGLFVLYQKAFYNPYRNADEIHTEPFLKDKDQFDEIINQAKRLSEIPCRRVYTRSYDGLRLAGRYYHIADDRPLCICFHGFRGSALRDFSVMGQFLQNEGYNVLIVDQRAHFKSGGHTIAYGIRERKDVLSWIEYANRRFGHDHPIYLFGISMGAATVVMASGLDLPPNVRLICADCPYSSPRDIITHVVRWSFKKAELVWPLIRFSALIFGRLNIRKDITAANAVKDTKTPVLIVHGEDDAFVPPAMSEAIHAANPAMVEYHTFPNAVHGVSYFSDPDRYIAIVRDFIKRHS